MLFWGFVPSTKAYSCDITGKPNLVPWQIWLPDHNFGTARHPLISNYLQLEMANRKRQTRRNHGHMVTSAICQIKSHSYFRYWWNEHVIIAAESQLIFKQLHFISIPAVDTIAFIFQILQLHVHAQPSTKSSSHGWTSRHVRGHRHELPRLRHHTETTHQNLTSQDIWRFVSQEHKVLQTLTDLWSSAEMYGHTGRYIWVHAIG